MRGDEAVWRSTDGCHVIGVGINEGELHLIAWEWTLYPGHSGAQYGEGCQRMIQFDGHPDSRVTRGVAFEDFYSNIQPANLAEKMKSLGGKLWGENVRTEDIHLGDADEDGAHVQRQEEAASREQGAIGLPPRWEIEVGEVFSNGDFGQEAISIQAVKHGEQSQRLVGWLDVNTKAAGIEAAARKAVEGIARLNAGLASAKPGIREKLLDVIETVRGE